MAEHARRALRIVRPLRTYERFLEDDLLHQPALIRELEVVGEASIHVSDEFRESHADWPWREMRDMRNQLIHGYASVDLGIVWDTARHGIPKLLRLLKRELGQLTKEHGGTVRRPRSPI